jgi:hypothetical protein
MEIKDIIAKLQAIITEIGGGTVTTADAPPGFVYVVPTGPRGAGKRRLWPNVMEGEMAWGYAQRMEKTIDPLTGFPYYPMGRYVSIGPAQSAWGGTLPETLDRMTHPFEWMTQEELDMHDKLVERDRRQGSDFSPN